MCVDDKHFIYMSSIAVHHHMHDKWQGTIDEAHPTRPGSLYGACKAAIEAHLWAANASHGQQFSAIRPCAVYGIDPSIKRSIGWPIIETVKHGKPYERTGGGKFVHVDDVADHAHPHCAAQVVEAVHMVVQRRALGAQLVGQRVDRQRVPALLRHQFGGDGGRHGEPAGDGFLTLGPKVPDLVVAHWKSPFRQSLRIRSAAFSAMAIVVMLVLADMMVGMIEASTTRRPSTPRTRHFSSSTA